VNGARLGWTLGVVLGLLPMLGGSAAARAQPASRPGVRDRHRSRLVAAQLAAYRREMRLAHPRVSPAGERPAPAQLETNGRSDVAFVTIRTATKGTSFYVDSRRVGKGSTVHQPLAPGYHRFQAVHPNGARWQKYLSFDAGDDRELIIHW
jgi:hypothetical protein